MDETRAVEEESFRRRKGKILESANERQEEEKALKERKYGSSVTNRGVVNRRRKIDGVR